ncbi:MAG: hypothetical protein ABL958_13825 [Bdellovibrionia bacterium]
MGKKALINLALVAGSFGTIIAATEAASFAYINISKINTAPWFRKSVYWVTERRVDPVSPMNLAVTEFPPRRNFDEPKHEEGSILVESLNPLERKHLPNGNTIDHIRAMKDDGSVAFEVDYTYDSDGHRVTPAVGPSEKRSHLLMLGCSFTFGSAVNDDETMPYYLARALPNARAYNWGRQAKGPNQALEDLSNERLRAKITERDGIAIYSLIPEQIGRFVPTIRGLQTGTDRPYYEVSESGAVKRFENYAAANPFMGFGIGLAASSLFLQALHLDFPFFTTTGDLKSVARALLAAKKIYLRNFNGRFIVLLFPAFDPVPGPILLRHLDEMGIEYLDYGILFLSEVAKRPYGADGHPTAESHQIVANQIAADLQADTYIRPNVKPKFPYTDIRLVFNK